MDIVERIEKRLMENKSCIKTYASHQFARSKAQRIDRQARAWANSGIELDFVLVYLPTFERWTPVFCFSSFLQRTGTGGYIGWVADEGFFCI